MNAISIKNAPNSFANFLMAMVVPFRWSYGEFIIEDTHDIDKFISYAMRNGVRESEIEMMTFEAVEL